MIRLVPRLIKSSEQPQPVAGENLWSIYKDSRMGGWICCAAMTTAEEKLPSDCSLEFGPHRRVRPR